MTRAFPFIRPTADVVRAQPWTQIVPDGTTALGDVLPDWDYNTVLALHRTVVIDGERARADARLPRTAQLNLSTRWTASGSLLRGLGARVSVAAIDDLPLELTFSLPGQELGGTLTLETVLSLSDRVAHPVERAATRAGSILWSDTFDVRLQGDAPLFPVAVVDFGGLPYPEGAPWFLELDRDMDAAAMGSILLLVNERCDLLVRALTEAGNPGPDVAAVLSTLRSEVARTLIEHALAADDFDPSGNYDTTSLGAALATLVARLNIDWQTLRREHGAEPSLFAARLHAATRTWAGMR